MAPSGGEAKYLLDRPRMLKPGETVTSDRYRQQLIKLNQALKRKRPEWGDKTHKVILLHDNARPHVAKPDKTYLENIKCDMPPHSPYSPDLASFDYYLFRSIQHELSEQHFDSYEEVKNWICEWLALKDERWYWEGIHQLPKRWKKVIDNDGQ